MCKTLFLYVILLFSLSMPVYAGIVVSINPVETQLGLGEIVGITLDIAGLGNGVALGSFDLSIDFDPALLQFNHVVFGDPLLGDQLDLAKQGQNLPSVTTTVGSVSLIEFSWDDSFVLLGQQANSFTLASLYFTAISSGISPLNLSLHSLADSEANYLVADNGNGSVSIHAPINAVPEPAAIWLLIPGLALLMFKRRNLHG